MTAFVDVILPGLFELPLEELEQDFLRSRLPALSHILRYSKQRPQDLHDFEALLADSLGLKSVACLPFAGAFDGKASGQARLLCEAVHLKPDMHNAYILPLDNSSKTNDHIAIIINDLSNFFKKDFSLSKIHENTWLMRLHQCPVALELPHSLTVIGRKADPYIKQSREVLAWYQLINEVQMFMHSHEVNQQRTREGLLAINSLWCWGCGEPLNLPDSNIQCFCDDYLISRWLENTGLKRQESGQVADVVLAKRNICIDLGLLKALKVPAGEDLSFELERVESGIFKPLLALVREGKIRLRLRSGHNHDLEIGRFSALKFWRQPAGLGRPGE